MQSVIARYGSQREFFYWLELQSCAVNSATLDVTRPTT